MMSHGYLYPAFCQKLYHQFPRFTYSCLVPAELAPCPSWQKSYTKKSQPCPPPRLLVFIPGSKTQKHFECYLLPTLVSRIAIVVPTKVCEETRISSSLGGFAGYEPVNVQMPSWCFVQSSLIVLQVVLPYGLAYIFGKDQGNGKMEIFGYAGSYFMLIIMQTHKESKYAR